MTTRSASPRRVSLCQMKRVGSPRPLAKRWKASWSQFEPGNCSTAMFIGRASRAGDLVVEVLDHRVAQEVAAEDVQLRPELRRVGGLDVQLDHLAHPRALQSRQA